jgi:aminocarboxymuconate-semialdehyde decarboxylase
MHVHTCRHPMAPSESGSGGGAGAVARGPRATRTIDLHCHALVPAVERLVADTPQKLAEPAIQLQTIGAASVEYNQRAMLPAAGPKLTTLELRLHDMDAMGVDIQVVSPSPTQYYYWSDLELAREIVRTTNEGIAALCARQPDRLVGLGSVALQHGELAASQVTHAMRELGLKGVEISTSVNGLELDDPSLAPFWRRAEELGCLVFIHPFGTSLGERVNRFYLQNVIGQPLETTIALSHLIFGGVLDRHPGIRIVAAHGGGYLPAYAGRSDHAWHGRPDAHTMQHPPSDYLRRVWFDTLVYTPAALRRLIDQVGVSQVVVGTDYPFDMGDYDVHALVASVTDLAPADQDAILGGNARRLLGLA